MKAAVANRVYTNWPECVTATETSWVSKGKGGTGVRPGLLVI
jgi:hypothetical protein